MFICICVYIYTLQTCVVYIACIPLYRSTPMIMRISLRLNLSIPWSDCVGYLSLGGILVSAVNFVSLGSSVRPLYRTRKYLPAHYGVDRSNRNDILTIMGVLFAATMFLGVYNSSSVQPVVGVERTVFYRERAAGDDSPSSGFGYRF